MNESSQPRFRLDRADIVRANRLAREAPSIDGYISWCSELIDDERLSLTDWLFRFGAEYNDGSRWLDVVAAADLSGDSLVATFVWSLHADTWAKVHTELLPWMANLDRQHRDELLRLASAFFALNERERYDLCMTNGGCTHWWHQPDS